MKMFFTGALLVFVFILLLFGPLLFSVVQQADNRAERQHREHQAYVKKMGWD